MKTIFQYLLTITLLLITIATFAQDCNVSGIVVNDSGQPLRGAIVFIGGSERVMPTDTNGRFNFAHILPGTYHLSVHMLGYAPFTQNITVKNVALIVQLKLHFKTVILNQVNIGGKSDLKKNYQLFKEKFLGKSANAKQCEILNPEIINFSTRKGRLLADADDFLIIENKRLGYRIHYLLDGFDYNNVDNIVLYHGECNFEELNGTDDQKKQWAKNRMETYKGSLTHFLRSVYANNTVENGFITKPIYRFPTIKYDTANVQLSDRLVIKDSPVLFDSLLTAVDSNFTAFAFKRPMYVVYAPKYALRFLSNKSDADEMVVVEKKGSILRTHTSQTLIDKRGNYTDYRDFFIQGYWAAARIGDQLPVEYNPPLADIPRRNVHTDPILNSLQRWTDSIPQEKAYLHLNKPYYVPGDTIWFKGYLTSGSRHLLSNVSGAVYVDLINNETMAVKTLKLPVDTGTVAGDFILSEDFKPGSYRIRAYTQWMRNAGSDYFFDQAFTVGDPKTFKERIDTLTSLQQTDVQFFPESGDLVNNITSKVAFKAVAPNGLGTPVNGVVVDNDNNQVAEFNTQHAGMGSFFMKPKLNKRYTAKVKFADGASKSFALPEVTDNNYILSVYQPNIDSVLVRILAPSVLQHSTIRLLVHSSGEVIFSSPVNINGAMTSIWLDKKTFPSGIAQFTIFDSNNDPLNERIAFIKGYDRMQLAIKTDKTVYNSKEHVLLELDAKNSDGIPVGANFSVAVIDQRKVPVNENAESTILSNILLTSDLRGYIEQPNYYFKADTGDVNEALDNLMLTQGYRRFEWKTLLNDRISEPIFTAEGLGTTISGTVTTLNKHLLANANILLVSTNAKITRITTTDANGRFKFTNLTFPDSARFDIQARTPDNTDHDVIYLDSIPKAIVSFKQNLADIIILKKQLQKAQDEGLPIKLTGSYLLKQVDIKAQQARENKKIVHQEMFSLPDEQSADHIYTIPDPDNFIDLRTFIQARIPNIRVETDAMGNNRLVDIRPVTTDGTSNDIPIILNGAKTAGAGDLLTGGINLEDIAKIEVVRNNQAIINMLRVGPTHPAGFLLIVTKPPSERKHYYPNIVNITPKGFNSVRQFYSPRYERPNNFSKPDNRSTIYWNPYVNTDVTGKATIDFYNADGPGNYRVVIEGIDAAGELGRQVYNYKVN